MKKSSAFCCSFCRAFFLRLSAFMFASMLFLPTPPVFSKEMSLKELLFDIRQKSAALTALSCNFTQKRSLALFNKPIVFQGQLALIRPDKLRWEFVSPVPSVLIFNGDKGLRCNDTDKPVKFDLANDPVMKMVAEQLWTWLDGDYSKLEKEYAIKITGESAILVTPQKQNTSNIIKNISIAFDSENRQPKSVTILEQGGDETLITFNDYQLSPTLPNSTFTKCFISD